MHPLEFIRREQGVRLRMSYRDHVFSVAPDVVGLDILPGSLVEEVFQINILLRNRTRQRPHGIAKTDGRPLVWGTRCVPLASCRGFIDRIRSTYRFIAARYLYLWIMGIEGWIFSKYIWWLQGMRVSNVTASHNIALRSATSFGCTYSSSIVSCGGRGSSRPSPIISQVKLLSTLPMPMPMLLLKLKSSIGPLGDSALKCHRSMSRLCAMAIEGSVTVKFAFAAARWFGCCFAALSTEMGRALLPSGLVDEPSCVLSRVSTCSADTLLAGMALPEAGKGLAHSIAPPRPSHNPSWDRSSA